MPFPTEQSIAWIFSLGAIGFVLSAAMVVLSRIRSARQRRVLRHLEMFLSAAEGREDDGRRKHEALELLITARKSWLMRLVANSTAPIAVQQLLAQAVLARVSISTLERDAVACGRRHEWRRIAALRILALGRPAEAWNYLERALVDGTTDVAGATIALLGRIPNRRAAVLLIGALRDGRHARSRIATAIQAFPLSVVDLLVPLLDAADPEVQYWGALLVQRSSAAGVSARLIELTRSPNAFVRKAALDSLAASRAIEGLAAVGVCLADPTSFVRAHAARAVAALGAAVCAPDVAPLLADKDWSVRFAAKQSLQALGPAGTVAALKYLDHRDAFARNGAAEVLQNVGLFEQLLAKEAIGPSNSERLWTLHLLVRAGGVRMWDTVVRRLTPAEQQRAKRFLAAGQWSSRELQEVS